MKKQLNILITCANSQVFPAVARALRRATLFECKLFGCDIATEPVIAQRFCDHYFNTLSGTDCSYAVDLLRQCTENDIDVVLFGSDEEQAAAMLHEADFLDAGISLALPKISTVINLSDKLKLSEVLSHRGINVPCFSSLSIENFSTTLEYFAGCYGSFILKPRFGRGSRGVKLVSKDWTLQEIFCQKNNFLAHVDQLQAYFETNNWDIPNWFVSAYLPGDKFSADILCSKGKIHNIVIRNNGKDPKINPPTQYAELSNNRDVQQYCEVVCEILDYDGFLQIECGYDSDSNIRIIEINTRLDASLVVVEGFGLNYHEAIVYHALTGRYPYMEQMDNKPLRFVRYWEHFFSEV